MINTAKIIPLIFFTCTFTLNGNSFYKSGPGEKIMDQTNFPPAINHHLQSELRMLLQTLKGSHYTGVFEIGAALARNAPTIVNDGFSYFGIDINPNFVEQAKQIYSRQYNASKFNVEALDFYDLSPEFFLNRNLNKHLIYLPFNLFGNFSDIKTAIKKLLETKQDFIIASYDITPTAYEARRAYYKSCGFDDLEYHETKNVAKFCSVDGLSSVAYDLSLIEKIILEEIPDIKSSLDIKKIKFGTFGTALHVSVKNTLKLSRR